MKRAIRQWIPEAKQLLTMGFSIAEIAYLMKKDPERVRIWLAPTPAEAEEFYRKKMKHLRRRGRKHPK